MYRNFDEDRMGHQDGDKQQHGYCNAICSDRDTIGSNSHGKRAMLDLSAAQFPCYDHCDGDDYGSGQGLLYEFDIEEF